METPYYPGAEIKIPKTIQINPSGDNMNRLGRPQMYKKDGFRFAQANGA
jgi:hypothetical protein